jgi:hypothetical protein
VNGCKSVSVTPTLKLTSGTYSGAKSTTITPGNSYVFKLMDNSAIAGSIYNANNGTSSSSLRILFQARELLPTSDTPFTSVLFRCQR